MAINIPHGLMPIGTVTSYVNREVNLMGVVTDFQPPAKSKGKDWTCSFRLADGTTFDDGFKIRFFKPMETELPKVERNGDVVLVERIKISSWSGMISALAGYGTTCTIFPAASIPEMVPNGRLNIKYLPMKGIAPSQGYMRYAIELCNSRERNSFNESSPAAKVDSTASSFTPSSARREKFGLIKDVKVDTFYDLVCQVVKVYPGNGVVELYVTDYTSNPFLFNYEWGRDDRDADIDNSEYACGASTTKRKWPGPFGRHTLTVSLFPPHSYYAQSHVTESQFVFLRNIRIKYSKDSKVEGSLHTDQRNPDRVNVTILKDHTDERVKEVLRRKLAYGKKFQSQQEAFNKENNIPPDEPGEALAELKRGQKRKQSEQSKETKAKKRQRMKQAREDAKRRKLKDLEPSSADDDDGDDKDKGNDDPYRIQVTPHPGAKRARKEAKPAPSISPSHKPSALNKNIRTSKPDIPPRPLSSILSLATYTLTTPSGIPFTLPFQNIKSRALVRIVDFFPRDIADFAVRKRKQSEFDVLSDCSAASSSSSDDDDDRDDHLPDDSEPDVDDDDNAEPTRNSRWEWRFALLLEDASSSSSSTVPSPNQQQLTAHITSTDAVFLLKLDACNLRRKPQALAALRERLFLLWGDLEERKARDATSQSNSNSNPDSNTDNKEEAKREMEGREGRESKEEGEGEGEAKSMPFECCIKEYGVRRRRRALGNAEAGGTVESEGEGKAEDWGWERKFAMFGTTIL